MPISVDAASVRPTRREFELLRFLVENRNRVLSRSRLLDRVRGRRIDSTIVADGCYLDRCTIADSVVPIRSHVSAGARMSRSVLLGADD